ncbi:mechanosensitive ion channel family protein [Oxalobacter vibrioformis]|uniref:Mechanosensitive ion channel family protein n=1 Tax=Oxalobacter vibrioformis TaxID=933080 RepID=A0A9E9P374_9BURK|nr:mechanosensitive ion channel family protein [Oxalobacter vibrioformis]WAW09718.1 mechanosensitive ion channel family protein [Oxalobacter vibrioformis]
MIKHLHNLFEHNTWQHFLVSGFIALALFVTLFGVRTFISRRLAKIAEHTATKWDDVLVDVFSSTRTDMLILLSVLGGIQTLEMSAVLRMITTRLLLVTLIVQCGMWANRFIRDVILMHIERDSRKGQVRTNYNIINYALRLVMWSLVVLLVLSNMGVNVTTLIASLGIGGVAVALAVQNILGDLFASLSIMLDKPFEVGDTLTVGDLTGTVKNIGLKTTRLTSITGEELVFANSDLLKSRIHNYKKMQERRIVYIVGIDANTPMKKLPRVNEIVREIFDGIGNARLDRVHFSNIGQYTFDYEIAYYVKNADYNLYMDVQQALNLGLVKKLGEAGIGLPFPTQTLQIRGLGKELLNATQHPEAPDPDTPGNDKSR